MSEQTQAAETTGADAGATTTTTQEQEATTTTATAAGKDAGTAATFTQADVDRIVSERLQRAEAKAKADADKAAQEATAKTLAEQGKFKELYEQLQAEKATQEAELQKVRLESMRQRVAARLNVPAALVERLQGDTEEAIEADAKTLLAALPKPTAPNTNASQNNSAAKATMTDAEKANLAAIYGVNPRFIQ